MFANAGVRDDKDITNAMWQDIKISVPCQENTMFQTVHYVWSLVHFNEVKFVNLFHYFLVNLDNDLVLVEFFLVMTISVNTIINYL